MVSEWLNNKSDHLVLRFVQSLVVAASRGCILDYPGPINRCVRVRCFPGNGHAVGDAALKSVISRQLHGHQRDACTVAEAQP